MKKLNIFIISFILTVIIGCGGGSGNISNDKNETLDNNNSYEILKNDANVEPIYKYNIDNSALLNLNNSRVNEYEIIEDELNNFQDDKIYFTNIINRYVNELLYFNSPIDNIPSYAPRGNNKNFVVDIINGKVDYSKYKLNGDIDENFEVDFNDIDLIINALYKNLDNIKYDANKDGIIDLKDIIYTLARIGSEIVYFDFYDLNGKKLNIQTRTINDSKNFDYNGSENKILVVAKDHNYASGYINGGLSDSSYEWYHKKGWKPVDDGIEEVKQLKKNVNDIIIQNSREILNEEIDPYLIGYRFTCKFVSNANLDSLGEYAYSIESWRWFFENEVEPKIKSHFIKTDMNKPAKKYIDSFGYYFHIGSKAGNLNEVIAKNITYKRSFTLGDKVVVLKRILNIYSVRFVSDADHTLKAHINSETYFNGKVSLKRVGPIPKEEEFEGSVEDNEIEVNNLPYGAYDFELETDCGCKLPLNKQVFEGDKLSFDIPSEKIYANATFIVKSPEGEFLSGKLITIESEDCINNNIQYSNFTDNSGTVIFDKLPIGKYKVTLEGKVYNIVICNNITKEFILNYNKQWIYKWTNYGDVSGSITIKNVTIDCDYSISIDPKYGKQCDTDFILAEFSTTGRFLLDTDSADYLSVWENYIALGGLKMEISPDNYIPIYLIATETEYVGMCWISWKKEYFEHLKNHTSFNIIGNHCNIEFKACSKDECPQ